MLTPWRSGSSSLPSRRGRPAWFTLRSSWVGARRDSLFCCEPLGCFQDVTQRHYCWHTDRADVEDGRPLVLDSDEGANFVPWIITSWRSSVLQEAELHHSLVEEQTVRAVMPPEQLALDVLMERCAFVARQTSTQELERLKDYLHDAIRALEFDGPSKPC